MTKTTIDKYTEIIQICKGIFEKKTTDYGTAWRILRISSLTDQIFIKAKRIRSIQEKGEQKIPEGVSGEFTAIINYCVIAVMQIRMEENASLNISYERLAPIYDGIVAETKSLLVNKNHDYGEVWCDMRVSSMTDIILMKLLRNKQIEENNGKTLISEGVENNYQDIINYAVFCLIKSDFI